VNARGMQVFTLILTFFSCNPYNLGQFAKAQNFRRTAPVSQSELMSRFVGSP
jgi:hypothetical protein